MRKTILISSLLFFAVMLPASAEEIVDFDQTINVERNGDLRISEVISYDFGLESKHGIFRDIPFKYKARGGNFNLRISDVSVSDGANNEIDFVVQKQGSDKRIKIGEADRLVTGRQYYVINYKVERAINFFNEQDEIYWNVTGDKWPVEIKQSKSTIILPEAVSESEMKMECFSGVYGSSDSCVSKRFVYEGAGQVKQAIFIDDVLQAGKGFTIVLGMPKGVVHQPFILLRLLNAIFDNLIIFLPLLLLIALGYYFYNNGRDLGGRKTIVAQFDAPLDLSPMSVGTLIDERADNKDFSANIISLAVKGHLKIVKIEEGSWFKKTDYALVSYAGGLASKAFEARPRQELVSSEEKILSAIFKKENLETDAKKLDEIKSLAGISEDVEIVLLSDLKNKFYKDLATIKSFVYKELTDSGYFKSNPQKIRGAYSAIGGFFIFFSFFLGDAFGVIGVVSVVLSGLMIIIFGIFMPAKTVKGVLAKEHILGLKEYLRVAEADRIKFHNAPEKNPSTFEKLLPFAMALGVEKEWAKQFEDVYKDQEPNWYASGSGHAFSAIALSDSMRAFSAHASTVASTSPSSASSGGSGFSGGGSGGGFGGGGGGSW